MPGQSWRGKKKEEGKVSQTSDNTTKLQSFSSQNSVVLVQNRHMDHWNRIESPETHLWSINLQRRRQEYQMGRKTVSSASCAGKVGQLLVSQ